MIRQKKKNLVEILPPYNTILYINMTKIKLVISKK